LQAAPTRKVIINLSLDGIAEKHDIVRGVKGNFERAMRTYAGPKALKGRYKNFTLGMHTVISRMKNPMGILPCPDRRARHTFGIDQCIVDMNRGIKPDLTIVDGSVGQDGEGPLYGDKACPLPGVIDLKTLQLNYKTCQCCLLSYEACPENAISVKGYSGTRTSL